MSDRANEYPRPAYAWYMVVLLLIIYTFSFIDRQILGLLGPAIKADFGISDTAFGLLTGPAFALFYATFGLYCARIADSKSRKWLIAIGLFLWSLMTALSALARNFTTLFLMRIGVGVGEATLGPAANSMLADSFPKKKLATAISVYSMGIPVGSALAFYIGGTVIELAAELPDIVIPAFGAVTDWQKSLLLVGIPGILLTVFVVALKEPSRKDVTGSGDAIPVKEAFAFFKARSKAYLSIYLGVSMIAALGFSTLIFLTFFFYRFHGMNPADIGQTFGMISIFTGPAGLLIGGYLADRWYKAGHKDAHIKALLVGPVVYLIPSLIFPLVSDTTTTWWIVGFANIFINSASGVAFAALQIITPNQMRGQIIAGYILSTNLIGYGAGPLLLGLMTDYIFMDPMKLNYALVLLAAVTTPLCIGLLLWGRKAYANALVQEEARINPGLKEAA